MCDSSQLLPIYPTLSYTTIHKLHCRTSARAGSKRSSMRTVRLDMCTLLWSSWVKLAADLSSPQSRCNSCFKQHQTTSSSILSYKAVHITAGHSMQFATWLGSFESKWCLPALNLLCSGNRLLEAHFGNPPPQSGCMHVCIMNRDQNLLFRFAVAGQQPDVTCAQSCRHVKLIKQLRTATALLSACFFCYSIAIWSIIDKISDPAQEQIMNKQIVITGSLWDVVRWLFVASLHYCIRFSQCYLPISPTISTSFKSVIIQKIWLL